MASYFTEDLFRFLQKLKRNNRREWFLQHKEEYEEVVHQPVLRFLADFAVFALEDCRHVYRART